MVLLNKSANDLLYVKNNKKQTKFSFFYAYTHSHNLFIHIYNVVYFIPFFNALKFQRDVSPMGIYTTVTVHGTYSESIIIYVKKNMSSAWND